MNERGEPGGELKRVLGPFDATCVVVGAIVGVGIFFTPKKVASLGGDEATALTIWVLGGTVAILGALTFAVLGRLYPKVGGQYDILRDAWGAPFAFLYVFCNLTAIQAGAVAVISIVCAENLGVAATGQTPSSTTVMVLANALIVSLVCANVVGVRLGSNIQNVTVLAKLATLVAVMALGVFLGRHALEPATPAAATGRQGSLLTVLFAGMIPAMFSYGGWQQALWMGGEVKDPLRNLPRAIIGGVLVVIVVYVGASWAYFRLLGYDGVVNSRALAAEAVSAVFPSFGGRAVALAVAFSSFGVLNAQFLTGPRLTYAMARDGRFFGVFGKLHHRFATPVPAILLLGGIAIALLLIAGRDGVDPLTAWVVVIDTLFFVLTGWSLVMLRRKHPEAAKISRPFLVIPITFGALEAMAIYGALAMPEVRNASIIGLVWVGCAALIYAIFFRRRR